MSIAKGTYLNGVRDEASLRARCSIDLISGCWRFQGCNCDGSPSIPVLLPDGRRLTRRGRRVSLMVRLGADLPPGLVAYPTPDCRWDDCVNPDHSTLGTRMEACRVASERGAYHTPKFMAALDTLQQSKRKISREVQMEIMHSNEPARQVAQRHRISSKRVQSIRAGVRKPGAKVTSVFEWRP